MFPERPVNIGTIGPVPPSKSQFAETMWCHSLLMPPGKKTKNTLACVFTVANVLGTCSYDVTGRLRDHTSQSRPLPVVINGKSPFSGWREPLRHLSGTCWPYTAQVTQTSGQPYLQFILWPFRHFWLQSCFAFKKMKFTDNNKNTEKLFQSIC